MNKKISKYQMQYCISCSTLCHKDKMHHDSPAKMPESAVCNLCYQDELEYNKKINRSYNEAR